jgi:hypothetical protein
MPAYHLARGLQDGKLAFGALAAHLSPRACARGLQARNGRVKIVVTMSNLAPAREGYSTGQRLWEIAGIVSPRACERGLQVGTATAVAVECLASRTSARAVGSHNDRYPFTASLALVRG